MLNVNTEFTFPRLHRSNYLRTAKWQFYWLCGLIIAFAYERPLAELTSFDRVNPRLFDVVFLVGLMMGLPFKRKVVSTPKMLIYWKWLIIWFCICAVVWSIFFLPPEYAQLSLFLAFQYLIGLVVIYWAINVPITEQQKKTLMLLAVCGGIFVSLYCIPEYLTGGTELDITEEKSFKVEKGTLLGPLGWTYFHIAQYQVLAFCLACALGAMARNNRWLIIWGAVALFISWPLFFCGSRTGIFLLAFSMLVLLVLNSKLRKMLVILSIFLLVGFSLTGINAVQEAFISGRTGERLLEYSEGSNSAESRLSSIIDFDISSYTWDGFIVPFLGAGFYVAPVFDGDVPRYRVDYGIHNIYLFVFEQSGALGLIFFLLFAIYTIKRLLKFRTSISEVDRLFAVALLSFFLAEMLAGNFGQIFWRGFGTGNFNTYLILMLCFACIPTGHSRITMQDIA